MKNEIVAVQRGSIADELEIEAGDKLLSINGQEVKDIIDYKFLIADENIKIEIEKPSGEIWELEIEKDYDDKLGIDFKESIMDKPKSCHNKCVFCFIDQLPKGMRDTLYFKDDDSRLAFLQGNFVTLTNMSDEDIDRIIKYRISPINVSVHTTNGELRVKMTNNRFASNIYERLKKLAKAGIKLNCQIVLCPGLNDNEELIKTIEDLYKLYPSIENLAVVPVGITKYRESLYHLNTFDSKSAKQQLDIANKLQKKYIQEIGTPFVRLSDEFYITANEQFPPASYYEEYKQLEDGVGVIRLFRDTISQDIHKLNSSGKVSFTLITGESAFWEIENAALKIHNKNRNININVIKIVNDFFGPTITVSGLITGKDIINQCKKEVLGKYVIIPNTMLRKGYELGKQDEQIFLDDITVSMLEEQLSRKVVICDYTGEDLIDTINKLMEEE
ncbi:MAG: putative FeS-containing Cyanobacterial-specific oxidoreductase [Clostridiaceae bacterium]|jgi:putative radical SAM enzyme (TIGR03279 family)|nr:putative FeS-containing Cyanobacterial-specific oxidoreductase [Clostridiaceae bacterium]